MGNVHSVRHKSIFQLFHVGHFEGHVLGADGLEVRVGRQAVSGDRLGIVVFKQFQLEIPVLNKADAGA